MVNRAERRRADKEAAKPPKDAREPTKTELDEAEREMEEGVTTLESTVYDRFGAQFSMWGQFEATRLMAEENYHLTFELPGQAKETFVQQYARARKGMIAVEKRMAETLRGAEEEDRERIMHQPLRMAGGVVQLPKSLVERLAQSLNGIEEEKHDS